MFYLSGRGNLQGYKKTNTEDEFGWYLEDREIIEDKIYNNSSQEIQSPVRFNGVNRVKRTVIGAAPLNSKISIFTCNDCDNETKNYELPGEFTKRENDGKNDSTEMEQIEMNSLKILENHEIDLEMIENDADHAVFTSSIKSTRDNFIDNDENEIVQTRPRGICYTPERLVRSQEYRILTPSPRYLTIPRSTPNSTDDISPRNYRGHRRKIGDLIDAKQFGASHLEALLDSGAPEIRLPITNRRRQNFRDRITMKKNIELDYQDELREPLEIANGKSPEAFETPDLASSRSSYERLNSSWEERARMIRRSSQDDTSGIHSNDWSTDTPSDIQTPICLCDELATASRSFITVKESRSRVTAINEVVSILEGLERDPDLAAAVLLEEDRFCDATSGHDRLTRLALSIEQDGSVPAVLGDPENLVIELGEKVERLQETTRNILKDIDVLREDFECNENKVDDLMDATITLRRDTNEMRYLDDLLNLLDGELERISRRNWPFVFGHNRAEDMNLVV